MHDFGMVGIAEQVRNVRLKFLVFIWEFGNWQKTGLVSNIMLDKSIEIFALNRCYDNNNQYDVHANIVVTNAGTKIWINHDQISFHFGIIFIPVCLNLSN
jgi:hypothetical protein